MKIFMMMITNMYIYVFICFSHTVTVTLQVANIYFYNILCLYDSVCILNVPLLNSVFGVYIHNSEASLFLLYFL